MANIDMHELDHTHYTGWKKKLLELSTKADMKNAIGADNDDYFISPDEIAIKHPVVDSIVRINDDGCIDIFAKSNLGIRLDPTTDSINLFGENINFLGKKINFKTKPDGLVWNGYHFNPQLYYEDENEKGQMLTGTKQYYHMSHEPDPKDRSVKWHTDSWGLQPMIKTTNKTKYSEGMIAILNDLGLPVE